MNTYNVHNMFALFNIIFASHDKANNGVILEVQLFSFIKGPYTCGSLVQSCDLNQTTLVHPHHVTRVTI